MTAMRRLWCLWTVVCLTGLLSGCGGSKAPTPVIGSYSAMEEDFYVREEVDANGLMTVAIPGLKPATPKAKPAPANGAAAGSTALPKSAPTTQAGVAADAPVARKEPVKGSPEWLLREIQYIKILPLPGAEVASKTSNDPEGDDEEKPLTAAEEQKLKEQFEKTKLVRRERNLQVIKLAEECIAKSAKQPELEAEFDAAVHYLLDSRLQLALQGDDASIEALFDAAKVFYELKQIGRAHV